MTAAERARRTRAADELGARAFTGCGCPDRGVALVAVGGYGRAELAPFSDLDLVLVHDAGVEPGGWAAEVWYPLWDSGRPVDHSVRSVEEVLEQCSGDLRVAMGMLDARHVAGDPALTVHLRVEVLTEWRRGSRLRLRELHALVHEGARRAGELAHVAVPDLKEGAGGLRDATALKALVASWLVEVPHAELERCRTGLLDVRDALQAVAGRSTDRVLPEYWPEIAEVLGLDDGAAAQALTRGLARRLAHVARVTWRRAEAVQRRPATGARRPQLQPLAPGLAVSHGEVVLAPGARPAAEPLLLLRAAAEAAERDLLLAPSTASRLARDAPDLTDPWPPGARDLFVRLLASGPALLGVWETLEETGALDRVLPEWERVRLLPHASVIHRFTVDRHLVETCVAASRLIRRVARPDVLVVAALLHDLGKSEPFDHSVAGAPLAGQIAARMGFDPRAVDLVTRLVRWHLLLPGTATTRDLEDPATVASVAGRVGDLEALTLLAALTEADARATSEQAWTSWRAALVQSLVRRVAGSFAGVLPGSGPGSAVGTPDGVAPDGGSDRRFELPAAVRRDPSAVAVVVEPSSDGSRVTVVGGDRLGLLADAAATLAVQRCAVRAARAWTQDGFGVSVWEVADQDLDEALLRQRLERLAAGDAARPRTGEGPPVLLDPAVVVRPDASRSATVLEVRCADRPWLLHVVCGALAELQVSVRSAHVDTVGPQAVDVFYLQEQAAGQLSDERAADAAHAVRRALVRAFPRSGQPPAATLEDWS